MIGGNGFDWGQYKVFVLNLITYKPMIVHKRPIGGNDWGQYKSIRGTDGGGRFLKF